ncbi:MAG: serine/threonine protein kinase, partial [Actinobacteria bacterium]
MAEVYLGRDRVLGRTIAVKTLLVQFAGDPHFIARFRREAQSAAALNHPNIVGVYDTGSDDGTHYIVMEYIEGRTLRDVIREEGPLLPERAAEIAGDVCAALAFAHSHGIVHRDVKPANIMMTKNGEVKVTDFGIARAASSETVTQTATVLGTAQYFSPEQAQAGKVDARSDIYSLG